MATKEEGLFHVPEPWKKLWDVWNLRAFIILSLSLQIFLILFAPFRKRTRRHWIIMPLWSAYLLADWVANFAVGLISSRQVDIGSGKKLHATSDNAVQNGDLLAFWAPFLLVHLGGPDTITAFAPEDNELWLRHFFGLLFQCLAGIYVFSQSLPNDKLWAPTMLMFFAGLIKYSERTRSLYLASSDCSEPGPSYAKLMDEYHWKKEARFPTRIAMIPEPTRVFKAANKAKERELTDLEVVQNAYRFCENFNLLLVDFVFSFRKRNQIREFFLVRSAEDAFRVVEVELNFIYEVLYTKLTVVYSKLGCVCRSLSFSATISAFILFGSLDKKDFEGFDVGITYTLLIGALALDVISFIMLIFSDWTVVVLKRSPYMNQSFLTEILSKLFRVKAHMGILRSKWSKSIATYNLIYYCLHQRSKAREIFYGYLGILSFLNEIIFVKRKEFSDEIRDFIFEELRTKSEMADDLETAKEICSSKGDWVLQVEGCSTILPYIVDVDYDECLLMWHIATELCYNVDKLNTDNHHRKFSKLLSDYMVYLLVMQPTMMSAVAGIGLIRFRDTCAEATKFFLRKKLVPEQDNKGFRFAVKKFFCGRKLDKETETPPITIDGEQVDAKHIEACKNILGVNTEIKPVIVKGNISKSVLFDGCMLAKDLQKLGAEKTGKDKWEIMSKVWVELLSYAASHIRASSHAQQVCRGGELITLVWLLMTDLGLGDHFQIHESHERAILIVEK